MNPMREARRWLWARGWSPSVPTMRAAFPDGPPATTQALREWADAVLPPPVLPPRPVREPGLTNADAVEILRTAGYGVTQRQIARAANDGSLRLSRDGRVLEGELRCWARRHLPAPAARSPEPVA